MKVAIVVGGWHYPYHFCETLSFCASKNECNLYIVEHRPPEFATPPISTDWGMDKHLYGLGCANGADLERKGFRRQKDPNTQGDWEYLNQWLNGRDYLRYDAFIFTHDDQYIRGDIIGETIRRAEERPDIKVWTHGRYTDAPQCYCRGSYELFRRELIEELGGRIPLGSPTLDRTGKTDTPEDFNALYDWNNTLVPLREYMVARKMEVGYLSPYYRVSQWMVEGERGLLSSNVGAPWSFSRGLEAWPL